MKEFKITTIAANKFEIASDLQFTHHTGHKFKGSTKIHEMYSPRLYPKPFYVGFCGGAQVCQQVVQWLSDPTDKPPKVSNAEFLILTQDKKMFTFNNPTNWLEIKEPYYAIGSGMQYAAGAMAAGKSPLEAVKIAAKHDNNTGMGYKTFSFPQKEKGPTKAPDLVAE